MVRVKICGITSVEDAGAAVEHGADAIGFVFWDKSPRRATAKAASMILRDTAPFVTGVGVFVNETTEKILAACSEAGINCAQLHGDEPPEQCLELQKAGVKVIKAFRVRSADDIRRAGAYHPGAYLLDTYREGVQGGTGETFDWKIAIEAKKYGKIILSGGLNPDNVLYAVRTVKPYAVDVSSGVESAPGKKDHDKIKRFMEAVKKT